MRKSPETRRTHNEGIAILKGMGRGKRLRIADFRRAYEVNQADRITQVLEAKGLVKQNREIAIDHYTLTDLAWSLDDFSSLLGE